MPFIQWDAGPIWYVPLECSMLTHKPGSAPQKPISQARLVQPGPDSTTTVEKKWKIVWWWNFYWMKISFRPKQKCILERGEQILLHWVHTDPVLPYWTTVLQMFTWLCLISLSNFINNKIFWTATETAWLQIWLWLSGPNI